MLGTLILRPPCSLVGTKDTKLEQKRDGQSKDTMVTLKAASCSFPSVSMFLVKLQSILPVFQHAPALPLLCCPSFLPFSSAKSCVLISLWSLLSNEQGPYLIHLNALCSYPSDHFWFLYVCVILPSRSNSTLAIVPHVSPSGCLALPAAALPFRALFFLPFVLFAHDLAFFFKNSKDLVIPRT